MIDAIFITGAAGVGKTALYEILKQKLPMFKIFDFDEGGVPEIPTVDWRKGRTDFWINKIISLNKEHKSVILCGLCFPVEIRSSKFFSYQMNLKFALLICNRETLINRLKNRNWPDFLINGQEKWQNELITSINLEKDHIVIDTTTESPIEVAEEIIDWILSLQPAMIN